MDETNRPAGAYQELWDGGLMVNGVVVCSEERREAIKAILELRERRAKQREAERQEARDSVKEAQTTYHEHTIRNNAFGIATAGQMDSAYPDKMFKDCSFVGTHPAADTVELERPNTSVTGKLNDVGEALAQIAFAHQWLAKAHPPNRAMARASLAAALELLK